MLWRSTFEKDYRRIFGEYRYGSTIWSPLAGGLLTGKYNAGTMPEGSRYSVHSYLDPIWSKWMGEDKKEGTLVKLNALGDLAKELGFTQAQLALAWAISNRDVSTCILGFTRIEQVTENLKALELYQQWNADIEKRVRDILGNDPEADMDWRRWAPMAARRDDVLKK